MNADLQEAARLRRLAKKWREYAEIGLASARSDRVAWADYLERLAEQAERDEPVKPDSGPH
jgi:hypothetical protein